MGVELLKTLYAATRDEYLMSYLPDIFYANL